MQLTGHICEKFCFLGILASTVLLLSSRGHAQGQSRTISRVPQIEVSLENIQAVLVTESGSDQFAQPCDTVEVDCDGGTTGPCIVHLTPEDCERLDLQDGEQVTRDLEPRIEFDESKDVTKYCRFRALVQSAGSGAEDDCDFQRNYARKYRECVSRYYEDHCATQRFDQGLNQEECNTLTGAKCSAEEYASYVRCGCGQSLDVCNACKDACDENRAACLADHSIDVDPGPHSCSNIQQFICVSVAHD